MTPAREEPFPPPADGNPVEAPAVSAVPARETRNLLTLALHLIVWRVGWTFKTESIITPAILDTVAGAGWLRGCLPLLGRLGHSVLPVFCVERLKAIRQKKWALAGCAALASLPYLALTGIWWGLGGEKRPWLAGVILALHFLFFAVYGLYQVSFGTVQGKLIRPTRRGRLLWGSTFVGVFPTIFFCQWLMPGWLDPPMPGYGYLFLFVGGLFVLSATVVSALVEPAEADAPQPAEVDAPQPVEKPGSVAQIVQTLRDDANLRRLVVVIQLFGLGLVTIPHYQNFARVQLGLTRKDLVFMVIAHTTAVTVYSLLVGPVADRWGNRLTLRVLILGAAIAPLYVLCLPALAGSVERGLFWIVFIPLALTPLVPTILINYALEMCQPAEHARYVSIVNLAIMPPCLLAPLVGMLVDVTGFQAVCVVTALLMLLCGLVTFRLDEPRHRVRSPAAAAVDVLVEQ